MNTITNAIAATTSTAATQTIQDAQAGSVLTSDFETFLQMLTAQAQYQDPLEPIDSSDYAAQLAQFSMVEQQVKSNEILNLLSTHLGAGNMAAMGGWIGMDVRSTAPAQFDGAPITLSPNPPAAADEVFLVVKDASGTEVQRSLIDVSAENTQWAGVDDSGQPFDPGVYSFELEAYAEGSVLSVTPVESYSRISEVRSEGGSTVLILGSGAAVTPDQITALRDGTSA